MLLLLAGSGSLRSSYWYSVPIITVRMVWLYLHCLVLATIHERHGLSAKTKRKEEVQVSRIRQVTCMPESADLVSSCPSRNGWLARSPVLLLVPVNTKWSIEIVMGFACLPATKYSQSFGAKDYTKPRTCVSLCQYERMALKCKARGFKCR
jgi:hypothetical protein